MRTRICCDDNSEVELWLMHLIKDSLCMKWLNLQKGREVFSIGEDNEEVRDSNGFE